jgi:hypothetical protein
LLAGRLLLGEKVDGVWHIERSVLEKFMDFSRRCYQKDLQQREASRAAAQRIQPLQDLVRHIQDPGQRVSGGRGSAHWAPPSSAGASSSFSENERNIYGWD